MTIIVGILCKDGVVIGADSSATFGPHQNQPTIEQPVQKVFVIQRRFIIAGTGQIGAGQRFNAAVDTGWTKDRFKSLDTPTEYGKTLCKLAIEDFGSTQLPKGTFGALVAFPIKSQHHLCELGLVDFQPELKNSKMWFASMGSGQSITDPFLGLMRRVFFQSGQPNLTEGLFLATWALQNAISLNPAGINGPPQVATLSFNKGEATAQIISDDELAEHKNSVEGAEKHLAEFLNRKSASPATTLPWPPSGMTAAKPV